MLRLPQTPSRKRKEETKGDMVEGKGNGIEKRQGRGSENNKRGREREKGAVR